MFRPNSWWISIVELNSRHRRVIDPRQTRNTDALKVYFVCFFSFFPTQRISHVEWADDLHSALLFFLFHFFLLRFSLASSRHRPNDIILGEVQMHCRCINAKSWVLSFSHCHESFMTTTMASYGCLCVCGLLYWNDCTYTRICDSALILFGTRVPTADGMWTSSIENDDAHHIRISMLNDLIRNRRRCRRCHRCGSHRFRNFILRYDATRHDTFPCILLSQFRKCNLQPSCQLDDRLLGVSL